APGLTLTSRAPRQAGFARPGAEKGSVTERLERRHDAFAALRTLYREKIPFVFLLTGTFPFNQEGGVFVDGFVVLPPFGGPLDRVEVAAAGHQSGGHLLRIEGFGRLE